MTEFLANLINILCCLCLRRSRHETEINSLKNDLGIVCCAEPVYRLFEDGVGDGEDGEGGEQGGGGGAYAAPEIGSPKVRPW